MITNISAPTLTNILTWAASEGWNPGLDDALAFHNADPLGFFVKILDNQPIAAISVVNHSKDFAFLGLYLCLPKYRGQGYGLALWNHAIQHAGTRVIGLDGVPDQQDNYHKSGFIWTGQTRRWQGDLALLPGLAPPLTQAQSTTPQSRQQIATWDQQQQGFTRTRFLDSWLKDTENRRSLVIKKPGGLSAYGTIRRCARGCKIGPLVAETAKDARDLLGALARLYPTETSVMIDIPANRPALPALLTPLGFNASFNTARMYRGVAPTQTPSKYHAVASLELG